MSEIRRRERWLIVHPESDCYFEVFSEQELNSALESDGNCADVTDDPVHEHLFQLYQAQR